ncbi:TetR/AcrR family transcriptional regulator [Cryobacterium sp. CG_9.6]|uniref:TetR/AcrR family transcriptional regulator n=1 Tax=Cryobacterium sp. CG_9.6 TaxID=2760710 RepID=UPI002475019D|nr:TetR/AcrR family transcriptional regulator [Cryobacterium sp. CG_9.6]MDH6235845.1 AcrR family transcriptional regulator [Cryobacterium sp. CG_9.6]
MSEAHELGLRERKRQETRRAIQVAVLRLVRQRGLDKVTVEDVSRMVNVSPRTFFNYFPSKSAAFIGEAPGIPSDADIEAFVHAGGGTESLVSQLMGLLESNLRRTEADRELYQLRLEVMRENSYLFGIYMATMRDFEQDLERILIRRFLVDRPELASDRQGLENRARLYALVATATIRHGWLRWANSDGTIPLSQHVRSSFDEMYEMTRRSD